VIILADRRMCERAYEEANQVLLKARIQIVIPCLCICTLVTVTTKHNGNYNQSRNGNYIKHISVINVLCVTPLH